MRAVIAAVAVIGLIGGWYWYTRPQPVALPVRHLAPAGTLFLTQRVSLATDAGVISFAEGTRVQAIAETGDKVHVRTEGRDLDVEKTKLTNDLDIAAAAAQRDAGARKKFEAWSRQQQAAVAQQRQAEAEAVERADAYRRAHAAPPMGSTPNPLDRGPYQQHP